MILYIRVWQIYLVYNLCNIIEMSIYWGWGILKEATTKGLWHNSENRLQDFELCDPKVTLDAHN